MKKLLLFALALIVSVSSFGQTFNYTERQGKIGLLSGTFYDLEPLLILEKQGKDSSELYKNVLNYIKITYKDPEKVILSTIENEYIRYEFVEKNFYQSTNNWGNWDYRFQIEVQFKNEKYRFEILSVAASMPNESDFIEQKLSFFVKNKKGVYSLDNFERFTSYFENLSKNIVDDNLVISKKDW
jgi:hypothetical protein